MTTQLIRLGCLLLALAIGGCVVQDKALRFARVRGISFRVASLGGLGTVVGPEPVHALRVPS